MSFWTLFWPMLAAVVAGFALWHLLPWLLLLLLITLAGLMWPIQALLMAWMKSHGATIHPFRSTAALERQIARERVLQARMPAGFWPTASAKSQFRLGIAFGELAKRRPGTEELRKSVAAFRAALPTLARVARPGRWLMRGKWGLAQRNLATSLLYLGRRELGGRHFEEALTAFREAAKELPRDKEPSDWAEIQSAMGALLIDMGQREPGTARLREGVTACREAVEAVRGDGYRMEIAKLEINLTYALAWLGERAGDTAPLEEAADVAWAALEVFLEDKDDILTSEEKALYASHCRSNFGKAQRALAVQKRDPALLQQAVKALEATSFRKENNGFEWAEGLHELCIALCLQGQHEDDTTLLERADAVGREALEVRTRETFPFYWALTTNEIGLALGSLGRKTRDIERLREAATCHRAALEVFEEADTPLQIESTRQALESAEASLREIEQDSDRDPSTSP